MPPYTYKHIRVGNSSKDRQFAQRSVLWKAIRRTMLTGSTAGVLVHRSAKDTTTKAALQKSYREVDRLEMTGIGALNCAYGTNMEDRALGEYVKCVKRFYEVNNPTSTVDVRVEQVSFYVEKAGLLMASPDGEVHVTLTHADGTVETSNGVVEVKCPASSFFAKRGSYKDVKTPITHAMYSDLLPVSTSTRKYGPPGFPKPRLDLHTPRTVKEMYCNPTSEFGAAGLYSQYYFQCVANLMLSTLEWVDFYVWTDPTKHRDPQDGEPKGHRFYYKDPQDEFASVHLERLYACDPVVIRDWEALLEAAREWSRENQAVLRRNIDLFLLTVLGEAYPLR